MSVQHQFKKSIKKLLLTAIPFSVRKHLSIWLNKQQWLGHNRHNWWSQELIRDYSPYNINDYHKFMWSNHLAYASPYDVNSKFGNNTIEESRKIFFADLRAHLTTLSLSPEKDIKSVFEVGCSLGYLLRYLEMHLFTSATNLDGIDIDGYAVRSGERHLRRVGSRVKLECADMESLESVLRNRMYDIIICPGVLMYLNEEAAAGVITSMLRHTNIMLAFAGLAHPTIKNSDLQFSLTRKSDNSFIHNIESMVTKAGGTIMASRWEGGMLVNGHTIYFVFATPSHNTGAG